MPKSLCFLVALLALFSIAAPMAQAAVVQLGAPASQYGTSSTLASFTALAGSDRLLVVTASHTGALNVTAVSFGASAMTEAIELDDGGAAVDSIWYLALGSSASSTTGSIAVTFTTPQGTGLEKFISAMVFTGVNQASPVSSVLSEQVLAGPNVPGSLNVVSATGDLAFALFDTFKSGVAPSVTPGAGQTLRASGGGAITGSGFAGYRTSTEPGAPSVTMSWTSTAEAMIHLAMNIKAVANTCAAFVFPYTLSGANNLARVANLRSAIECANANGAGADVIDLNAQSVALEANNVYATYAGPTGLPQITSSVTIRNGTVLHDTSAGGTQFRTFDILGSGTLTLQNVVLQGDSAPTPGGAFYNRGTLNVSQTRISGYSTGNRGGVLFNDTGAIANLSNALLYDNNAVFAHAIDNQGSVSIINSTFDKHTSISNFGAVLEGTGYTLRNSIFWNPGSGPTQIATGNTVSNSIVKGGYSGGTNVLNTSPLFVNEGGNDFRLANASPAIDAGNNANAAGFTTDLDGNPRFYNDTGVTDTGTGTPPIVDLGAYEKQTNSPSLDPAVSISVSPISVLEDGTANLVYTVTRNPVLPTATTVNITTGGTATSGSDYTGGVATLVIPAGTTAVGFPINPTPDTMVEPDETVILTVAPGTGYTVGSPSSATGTIQNDDVDPCASISFPYTLPNNLPATLITAIECANANGTSADTINLNSQTVTLTDAFANYSGATGLPQVTTPVTVRNGTLTRTGSNEFRFLSVSNTGNLTVRDMSLTNGGGPTYANNGGSIISLGTASTLVVVNTTVSGSQIGTLNNGSGISSNASFTIVNSSVIGGGTGRGAIASGNGPVLIQNTVITGNSGSATVNNAGGVYFASVSSATIVNSTIAGNYTAATAATQPGGIYADGSAVNLTIRNSIIWGNSNAGNTAPQISNTTAGSNTVTNSIIQGGQFGALGSDPLFVTPITASATPSTAGNFQLDNLSPAIDAGANANVPVDSLDVNGNSNTIEDAPDRAGATRRVNDTGVADTGSGTAPIVDIGAYEKQTNSTLPVPSVSIAVSPASVSEDGGTNLTYTVTRNPSLPTATTVNITTAGTAISGSDYTGAVATVVILADATTATITIDPTVDSTAEPNETVILTVATGSGYAVGAPASATGTINNDDNAPPTISNVANQTINEDGNTGALAVTVGDAETAVGSLIMSGSSSDTTLVPNANIVFGGSGASRTVTVTPVANLSGTSTITLTVTDGNSGTASDTFLLTVNAVNDLPSFTAGGNQSHPSGTSTAQTVAGWATAISDGDADFTQTLTFNVSNNNNGLFTTQPTVNSSTGTLSYTPNGTSGSATVSVSLTDDATAGGAALTSAVQTFTITVSANTPPTISDITNQSTNEDTATGPIAFTVGDTETTVGSLTVSGTSSNTTLVPNGNLVFGGSGANRTLTITPAANLSGTSTITVTVNDGTANTSDTFLLTVNAVNDTPSFVKGSDQSLPSGTSTAQTVAGWAAAISDGDPEVTQVLTFNVSNNNNGLFSTQPTVNSLTGTLSYTPNGTSGSAVVSVSLTDDNTAGGAALTSAVQTFTITVSANTPPTISDITNQSTNEDTATGPIAFTVGDTETTVGSLTVSGTSSNTTLVPNANLVFGGSGANRTVTITPAANLSGTSTIIVTVNDGTANTSDTFLLTVNAVNDLPSFVKGSDQSQPAGTNTAQTVAGWATAISDGDPEVTQVLTFNVSNNNNGLFSTQPTVNSLTGTLSYTPNGTSGSATISVSLTDDNTAGGAALTSAVQTFLITVSANSPPTISDITNQSTNEDTASGAIAFTVGDAETAVGSLTVSGTSSNTTLLPNANLVFGGSGANRTLTITPAANLSGTSTITVTVNDGTANTSDTFLLTVNAVNDTPSFVKGSDQSLPSGTSTAQTVAGWATAISDGDADFTQALTFNVSNNNNGLFTTQPSVASNGTLSYTPNGTSGSATISVSLTDDATAGGAALTSAVQTFLISVSANTPPTISDITNQTTNEDTTTSAIAFTVGDTESGSESLTVNGTSSNTTLVPNGNLVFAGVGPNRTVTITPAANLSGTSTITVTVNDGTANTSDTFLLTVNAVNDTPSFVKGADQSQPSGTNTAQTVPTWATAINDGDADFTQAVTFNVSNNNNGLFTTQPSVASNGTLSYTPNGTSGSATVSVSLTDDATAGGAALTSAVQTFTITVAVAVNTPPVFTAGAAITRQQGSPASAANLGVVSDLPDTAGSLSVTAISGGSGSGFTVNALSNNNGLITGTVAAGCSALAGTQRFQVTDSGGLTGTGDLQINVSPNTGPSLSYAAQNVGVGNSLSISPTAPPSDNGTVTSVIVQSAGTYTGSISVNSAGVITLSNAQPAGLHTLTIRSTDNCGLSTDSTVDVTVGQASTFKLITANVTPSRFGEPVTFSVQVVGVNPTGSVTFLNGSTPIGTGILAASPSGGANLKLASLTVSSLAIGSQTIRATYPGDANNTASTSPDLAHSVLAAGTRITLTPAANPASVGNSVVAIQVAPEAPGGGIPQGQVTLAAGAVNCTAALTAGAGSCALNLSTLGYQPITASYLPSNGNHTASTGSTAVVVLGASGSTDLRVRIGNGVRNIEAGKLISYQIVVDNLGTEAAVGRLQVPVSADFTGASYSCLSDGQANCGVRAGTGSIDTDVSLAPGGVVIYTLSVTAPLAPERTLSQGASVSIRAPSTDPDLSNNSAEDIDPMGLLSDGFEAPSVIE